MPVNGMYTQTEIDALYQFNQAGDYLGYWRYRKSLDGSGSIADWAYKYHDTTDSDKKWRYQVEASNMWAGLEWGTPEYDHIARLIMHADFNYILEDRMPPTAEEFRDAHDVLGWRWICRVPFMCGFLDDAENNGDHPSDPSVPDAPTNPENPNDPDDSENPDDPDDDDPNDDLPDDDLPDDDAPTEGPPVPIVGPRSCPLILDLDGDGVEASASGFFDHERDGFAEFTRWVGGDDGLLVWDRNGDGVINSGRELFGNNTVLSDNNWAENGFAALAELDSNDDGVVGADDANFAALQILRWTDADGDGEKDTMELISLADAGVQSLNTGFVNSDYVDEDGNEHRQIGSYVKTDASRRRAIIGESFFLRRQAAFGGDGGFGFSLSRLRIGR